MAPELPEAEYEQLEAVWPESYSIGRDARVSLVQRWIVGRIAHARDVIRIASSRPLDQVRGKTPAHSPSRP